MVIPVLLFAVPLVTAIVMLGVRSSSLRNHIVKASALLMMVLAVATGFLFFGHPTKVGVDSEALRLTMTAVDGLAALTVLYYCTKFKRYLVGKRRLCCSLPEGDMIHDYLRDCYEQILSDLQSSEIPFKGDMVAFLDSRNVDFPYVEIDIESF